MTARPFIVLLLTTAIANVCSVAPAAQDANESGAPILIVENVEYARVGDRTLALTAAFPRNPGDALLPVVVYVHGGRWSAGAKEDGRAVTEFFARRGYLAVTVDYRLAGEAKYPAALHDIKAAIRFLRRHATPLGIDPDRIGIWGHTAGGHLAALVATTGNAPALAGNVGGGGEEISSGVRCAVDVSGPGDLFRPDFTEAGRGIIANWLGTAEGPRARALAREASPVTHADADDPPLLIVHGVDDPLVPLEHARSFHTRLRGAGVITELHAVEGAGHHIDDAEALPPIAAFFDKHLSGHAASP